MPPKKTIDKKQSDSDVQEEDINEYKGIHFNEDKDAHYIDNKTGAHFNYSELFNQLTLISLERSSHDTNYTTNNPTTRSISSEKNKKTNPDYIAHEAIQLQSKPKNTKNKIDEKSKTMMNKLHPKAEAPKKQPKAIFIKLQKANKPMTSALTNKPQASHLFKHNTIDNHSKRLFSPQKCTSSKPSLKTNQMDFNFKSLDNRKCIETIPMASTTQYSKIRDMLTPKKSLPVKQITIKGSYLSIGNVFSPMYSHLKGSKSSAK